ncbi:MAG: DUF5320 domain-containing protein [Dehalococcoidales bacterium]|jgi:hypothetical protein
MPGFDGTGPNGMGPMTGGGRGLCNPRGGSPRQYVFARRGGYAFPRYRYETRGYRPFAPRATREQEFEFLKGRAEALRDELNELETEIGKLSGEKG